MLEGDGDQIALVIHVFIVSKTWWIVLRSLNQNSSLLVMNKANFYGDMPPAFCTHTRLKDGMGTGICIPKGIPLFQNRVPSPKQGFQTQMVCGDGNPYSGRPSCPQDRLSSPTTQQKGNGPNKNQGFCLLHFVRPTWV